MTTASVPLTRPRSSSAPVRANRLARTAGIAVIGLAGGGALAKAGLSLNELSFPDIPPSAAAPVASARTFALSSRSAAPVTAASISELTMPAIAAGALERVSAEVAQVALQVSTPSQPSVQPPTPVTAAVAAAAISRSVHLGSVQDAELRWMLSELIEHHSLVLTGNSQGAAGFVTTLGEFMSKRKQTQSDLFGKTSIRQLQVAIDNHYSTNIGTVIRAALDSGIAVQAQLAASK